MRFTKLYEDVKASDLFKPASPEEVAKRQEQYPEMRLKEVFDNIKKKTKLPDGSWYVYGDLDVSDCGLKTLKSVNVSFVTEDFNCIDNDLLTLEGGPKEIGVNYYCDMNRLTSLIGAPVNTTGDFSCCCNDLRTLKGAPKYVGGTFLCEDNSKQFTEAEVRAVSDVKVNILV